MGVLRFLHSQCLVSPPRQEYDFTDQVIVITGGNSGLGLEAAKQVIELNAAKVIVTVRSEEKGQAAVAAMDLSSGGKRRAEYVLLDMGSYRSVLDCAKQLAARPRVDAVVLNAGFATTDFAVLEDNESTITVNVVSTMLLAVLMAPILRQTAQSLGTLGRICVITSDTHEWTSLRTEREQSNIFEALNNVETARMDERQEHTYFASKLLEIFAVRAMSQIFVAKPEPQPVVICAVNPGLCHSSLTTGIGGLEEWKYWAMTNLLGRSTEAGAKTYVHALSLGFACNGKYLSDYDIRDDQLSVFAQSFEGRRTQDRVWMEIAEKLERIRPGILRALSQDSA